MLAGDIEKLNGSSNVLAASSISISLPLKGPSQAMSYSPTYTETQLDMTRPCSTNIQTEEQPSWLEDLLNEPESPSNKGHRRSGTDPFSFLDPNSEMDEEVCLGNSMGGPTWNLQIPRTSEDQVQSNSKHGPTPERQNSWISSSISPPLPNGFSSLKEEAEFKALGLCCSPPEWRSQGENCLWGSCYNQFQMKPMIPPPISKSDIKRKQHNARKSRIRKLQYISELERSVHALQVDGVEVSAHLEFLDQQNLVLGMENRALKQRLDNLSQELFIKSLEQEILDRELGRLQHLYQMQNMNHHQLRQRHKQIPVVDRRGRSCDFDSQFSNLSLNPPEAIAACTGLKDFPYSLRN